MLFGVDLIFFFIRLNEGGLGWLGIVIDLDFDLKKFNIIRCFCLIGFFLFFFLEELKDVKSMVLCMDKNIMLYILLYFFFYRILGCNIMLIFGGVG